MSLKEPRCLVCGNPLDAGAPFQKDVRDSEVCSDRCYKVYMYDEDRSEVEALQNRISELEAENEQLNTRLCEWDDKWEKMFDENHVLKQENERLTRYNDEGKKKMCVTSPYCYGDFKNCPNDLLVLQQKHSDQKRIEELEEEAERHYTEYLDQAKLIAKLKAENERLRKQVEELTSEVDMAYEEQCGCLDRF